MRSATRCPEVLEQKDFVFFAAQHKLVEIPPARSYSATFNEKRLRHLFFHQPYIRDLLKQLDQLTAACLSQRVVILIQIHLIRVAGSKVYPDFVSGDREPVLRCKFCQFRRLDCFPNVRTVRMNDQRTCPWSSTEIRDEYFTKSGSCPSRSVFYRC